MTEYRVNLGRMFCFLDFQGVADRQAYRKRRFPHAVGHRAGASDPRQENASRQGGCLVVDLVFCESQHWCARRLSCCSTWTLLILFSCSVMMMMTDGLFSVSSRGGGDHPSGPRGSSGHSVSAEIHPGGNDASQTRSGRDAVYVSALSW